MNRSEVRKARRNLHAHQFSLPPDDPDLLDTARATGDADLIAEVLITLGSCAFLRGDLHLFDDYVRQAHGLLKNVDSVRWTGPEAPLPAILSLSRGLLAIRRGERADAGHLLMQSFDQAINANDRKLAAFAWSNLASLEAAKGHLIPATALYHRLLTWPAGLGRLHGGPRLGLARIALVDGDLGRARSNLAGALSSDRSSVPWWRAARQLLLAGVELATDRAAEAAAALDDPILASPGGHGEAKEILLLRVAIARNELDRAETLAVDLQPDLDTPLNRIKFSAVRIAEAALAKAHGRTAVALDLLADADTPYTTYEARVVIATERARLLAAVGHHREAAEQVRELRRIRATSRAQFVPGLSDTASSAQRRRLDNPDRTEAQVVAGALEPAYERMRALELEDLLNQRRELVGVVAHDLRGALATCRMAEPMLTSQEAPEDERSAGATALSHAVESMRSIVDVLGQLLSIGADGGVAETRAGHVGHTVSSAVAAAIPMAEAKGQTIRLVDDLDPNRDASADLGVVSVVVSSMLSNAIKYSPLGVPIDVRVAHKLDEYGTSWATVAVRDYGQGMTPEDLQVAWRRYTKASAAPTGRETSLGLGLYIARELSERVGARVKAESQGVGSGSTFTLQILVTEAEDLLPSPPNPETTSARGPSWLKAPRVVLPV